MRVLMSCLVAALSAVGMMVSPVMAEPVAQVAVPALAVGQLTLTPSFMYDFLVAQVAGQRGQWSVASQAYLQLAQETGDASLARNAVEAALLARQPDQALRAAKLWLKTEPQSVNAQHAVIALLLDGSHPMEALPYLQQDLQQHPLTAGAEFLRLGDLLTNQQDRDTGLALVTALAKDYPKLPEAHLAVAQAAARAGQFDRALAELDEVDADKPSWALAAKLRYEVLNHNHPEQAEAYVAHYLQVHPDANDVRLVWARSLLAQNRLKESRHQFMLLARVLPDNVQMQVAEGLVSLQMNDLVRADAAFKRALALNDGDPGLIDVYLGQIAEAQHRDDEAAAWYRAVPAGDQFLGAQIRYAALLAKQGKLDAARSWLQAVPVEQDSDRVELIRVEAQLLHDAHQDEQAYDLLTKALATRPDSVDLLYDHAMLAEPLGHLDVAERDLRYLLTLQPNHAQALNALGYTFADHNIKLVEAEKLVQQALKLLPTDAFILDSMGWVEYRLGNLQLAAEYLHRAYHSMKDPEIAAHLGEVLWMQGKHDEARKIWDAALTVNPDSTELRAASNKFK